MTYLILNIVEGKVGTIKQRDTWEEALAVAVKMAAEQCNVPEDQIREELENDTNFVSPNDDIEVMIAQADADQRKENYVNYPGINS